MKENIEEEKAIKYYENKDISFSVDFNTKELLEALGITEEDNFEKHQIRFKTLLNLIEKLQKENEELKQKYDVFVKMSSDVIANSIPTQKVKDKIEELEEKRIKMEKDDIGVGFTLGEEWSDLKSKIKAYKDLLEEKGE